MKKMMSSEELAPLKPFLSVFLIVSSMFIIVFAKMEERRIGYAVLKMTHEQHVVQEVKRTKVLQLAKMTRPEHVEAIAHDRFTLKKVQNNQIILLTGGSVSSALDPALSNQKEL
jgi:hypothetical protein